MYFLSVCTYLCTKTKNSVETYRFNAIFLGAGGGGRTLSGWFAVCKFDGATCCDCVVVAAFANTCSYENKKCVLKVCTLTVHNSGENFVQLGGGVCFLAIHMVAVDTEGVHAAAVSHKGFELAFWQLLGDADKGVAHLIESHRGDAVVGAEAAPAIQQMLLTDLRCDVLQAAGQFSLGVLLCLAVGADVYSALGVAFAVPWVGTALTGIFASRGSNYISDLAKRLQNILAGDGK